MQLCLCAQPRGDFSPSLLPSPCLPYGGAGAEGRPGARVTPAEGSHTGARGEFTTEEGRSSPLPTLLHVWALARSRNTFIQS